MIKRRGHFYDIYTEDKLDLFENGVGNQRINQSEVIKILSTSLELTPECI